LQKIFNRTIEYFVNNEIVSIEMNGHSGYAESGKDIVCAGVSSLVYAAINSFNSIEEQRISIDDGMLKLNLRGKKVSDHDQIVLEVMLNGFSMIASQYKKNVKSVKKEN
jgi:uncharacterized protein YsxB (DUF464 family)